MHVTCPTQSLSLSLSLLYLMISTLHGEYDTTRISTFCNFTPAKLRTNTLVIIEDNNNPQKEKEQSSLWLWHTKGPFYVDGELYIQGKAKTEAWKKYTSPLYFWESLMIPVVPAVRVHFFMCVCTKAVRSISKGYALQ